MTEGGADRWAVEKAVKASALPAPSRLLLMMLLTRTDNGTAAIPAKFSPSLATLVRETGLGRGTVADHLKKLEKAGWLVRQRPTTMQAIKDHARTGYRITVPADLVRELDQSGSWTSPGAGLGDEESQVGASPGAGPVREPDGTSPGAGHNPTSSQPSSPSERNKGGAGGKSRRKSTEEHPRFGEWYAQYPAKKARGAAVTAFNKAARKVDDVQVLIDGAIRYRDTDPHVARGYIANPATWLNQERWLDEPAPKTTGARAPGANPNEYTDEDYASGF